MRAYDGEHSEWFDATQGLRQDCVLLSPLLFNVAFAAAIYAVLTRLSKDEVVVRGCFTLRRMGWSKTKSEQRGAGCVRRDVWGTLYADAVERAIFRQSG